MRMQEDIQSFVAIIKIGGQNQIKDEAVFSHKWKGKMKQAKRSTY